MRKPALLLFLLALPPACAIPAPAGREAVAHDVFIDLVDHAPEHVAELVRACRQLADLPGVELLAVGPRAAECTRPINDLSFDVALRIVFRDLAAYRAYQTDPRHVALVEHWRGSIARLRVFDSRPGELPD